MWSVLVNNATNRQALMDHFLKVDEAVMQILERANDPDVDLLLVGDFGDFIALSGSITFAFSRGYYDFHSFDEILAIQLMPTEEAKNLYAKQFFSRNMPKDIGSVSPIFGDSYDPSN